MRNILDTSQFKVATCQWIELCEQQENLYLPSLNGLWFMGFLCKLDSNEEVINKPVSENMFLFFLISPFGFQSIHKQIFPCTPNRDMRRYFITAQVQPDPFTNG